MSRIRKKGKVIPKIASIIKPNAYQNDNEKGKYAIILNDTIRVF